MRIPYPMTAAKQSTKGFGDAKIDKKTRMVPYCQRVPAEMTSRIY